MDEQGPSRKLDELLRDRTLLDAELEQHQRLLTILFADIVGSTAFYDQHGGVAGLVMVQKCLGLLTPTVAQHAGAVVKTIGDALLVRFERPVDGVRCAIAMQQALTERNANRPLADQIHIRVAVNYGLGLVQE